MGSSDRVAFHAQDLADARSTDSDGATMYSAYPPSCEMPLHHTDQGREGLQDSFAYSPSSRRPQPTRDPQRTVR
jgi:hypothetical protein